MRKYYVSVQSTHTKMMSCKGQQETRILFLFVFELDNKYEVMKNRILTVKEICSWLQPWLDG